MRLSPRLQRLKDSLTSGRGVLFLGPEFGRTIEQADMGSILEAMTDQLADGSGWDKLEMDQRYGLFCQAIGPEALADGICDRLPSIDALRSSFKSFHRSLLDIPFPLIVDTAFNDLTEAVTMEAQQPIRILTADEDLVTRPTALAGERTLVKLRGDLWLGQPAFTLESLNERFKTNPSLFSLIRSQATRGPCFFYGFDVLDPILHWLKDALSPLSGTSFLATRIGNTHWRQYWEQQGFEIISGGTYTEVESKVESLCESLDPSSSLPDISTLTTKIGQTVAREITSSKILDWAQGSRGDIESIPKDELEPVLDSIRFLSALANRGLPVPPLPSAYASEITLRAGNMAMARQALEVAVGALGHQVEPDPFADAAVGRVLNRMGDADRARFYLRRALSADGREEKDRADDMAWLSRCVLDRIERLKARGRGRAVMELIAAFLKEQAQSIYLAKLDPDSDEELQWSVYYINLRLGRLMAMASELAGSSSSVYAEQAVGLLTRAIELAPHKPDAYKSVRPLLTDPRYGTSDSKQWMALVASAPPPVQRRLGGR